MVHGKDTLPYKDSLEIQKDTSYFDHKTYYPGDTLYIGTCRTFEKIHGQIVNQSDTNCHAFGLWIITDSLGNYWRGILNDGAKEGTWQKFNKVGKLLMDEESVYDDDKTYIIKQIDYTGAHPRTLVSKPFFGFFIKHYFFILAAIMVMFFARVFINSRIYNIENGTNQSPIYFYAPGYISNNFYHSLLCTFTLWFFRYKPENRRLAMISHWLSVLSVGSFLAILIGLGIGGELN